MQVTTNHSRQELGGNRKKTGVENHHTGARIDWDDRRKPYVAVYCANREQCVTPGEKVYVSQASANHETWSGRCPACIARDGLPLRLTGRHEYDSGAAVDFDDRNNTRERAKATCPDGIHPRYILADKIAKKIREGNGVGLCRSCIRMGPRPTEDVTLKPSNSIEHWSESTKDNVPVTCGYCSKKREIKIKTINDRQKDGRGFTGLCQNHRIEDLQSFYLSAAAEYTNLKEKRGRGRLAGGENFDRSQFLSELAKAIRDLAGKGKKERDISRKLVAQNYELGGQFISADTLTKRLRLSGVEMPFPDYVESVLRVTP